MIGDNTVCTASLSKWSVLCQKAEFNIISNVIHMNLSKFYIEQGEVNLNDKFISLRLVKEALERDLRIAVIDESSKHLSCKMIRWARLYGAPSIFPHPKLELRFIDRNNMTIIRYRYQNNDLILALICTSVFIALGPQIFETASIWAGLGYGFLLFVGFSIFAWLAVFLDTKYYVYLIKKALKKI
jgi:hypothetical protein